MPSGIEVTKAALDDFNKIQEYMLLVCCPDYIWRNSAG